MGRGQALGISFSCPHLNQFNVTAVNSHLLPSSSAGQSSWLKTHIGFGQGEATNSPVRAATCGVTILVLCNGWWCMWSCSASSWWGLVESEHLYRQVLLTQGTRRLQMCLGDLCSSHLRLQLLCWRKRHQCWFQLKAAAKGSASLNSLRQHSYMTDLLRSAGFLLI